ncbi:hypothetical protein J6590_032400 [Homalodisca vitripennis]|nr:hypothetical protein J6590_032400 [Homalodisca vitripennis]
MDEVPGVSRLHHTDHRDILWSARTRVWRLMRKPLRKDESAGIAEAPSVSRLHHTDRRDRHVTCGDESAGIAEAPSVSRLHHTDRRDRHVTCGVREHVCGDS